MRNNLIQDDMTKITKYSLAFINRFRITILLLASILIVGGLAYTQFLPRDGFPAIAQAATQVRVTYLASESIETTQAEVVEPIEDVLLGIEEIDSVNSTNTGQFVSILIFFDANQISDSEEANTLVAEEVSNLVMLPEAAQVEYVPLKFDAIDGVNDLVFTVYSEDASYRDLDAFATALGAGLKSESGIKEVNVDTNFISQNVGGDLVEQQRSAYRYTTSTEDGFKSYNAVSVGVVKQKGLSAEDLSTTVRDAVESASESAAKDVDLDVDDFEIAYVGDIAVINQQQIDSLESNLSSGLILVMVVLLVIVNWRASLVTGIFIPTVLGMTFVLMFIFGSTLNVISLFGLILALGLFVDDAIVVVEAIDYNRKQGLSGLDAVKKAINEVGAADVMGTLTTALVFAPILFTSGVLGEFIQELPRTIIISLLSSLFVALSIIPLLYSLFTKSPEFLQKFTILSKIDNAFQFVPNLFTKVGELLGLWTSKVLASRWLTSIVFVVSIVIILFGFSLGSILGQYRFNPFPPSKDSNSIQMELRGSGTGVDDISAKLDEVEGYIEDEFTEVEEIEYFSVGAENVFAFLQLSDLNERERTSPEIVESLTEYYSQDEGNVQVTFQVVSDGPPTDEFPVKFQVYSEDPDVLEELSADVVEFLEGQVIERDASSFAEFFVGDVSDQQIETVKLSNMTTVTRSDGQRFVQVEASITDNTDIRSVEEFQKLVEDKFTAEYLRDNYDVGEGALGFDLGQQSENIDSLQSLYLAGILAVILMYGLLVWQFNSYGQPVLIIFVAVTLALPGVFAGLLLTDNYLGFLSTIGLIGLVGIVVNNTIMLVDFANQGIARGQDDSDAMAEAIKVRFRPLVTTTLTTLGGLLPLALFDPFWEPISFTIIFGLASSTFFVLFAFPVYFKMMQWMRAHRVVVLVSGVALAVIIAGISTILG